MSRAYIAYVGTIQGLYEFYTGISQGYVGFRKSHSKERENQMEVGCLEIPQD